MATFPWGTPSSLTSYLSSSLNSLAASTTDLGGEIDNGTTKATYMDLLLNLASLDLSAASNPAVDVYLIPAVDGTNYDTADDAVSADASVPPADQLLTRIGLRKGTAAEAKRESKVALVIPPCKFKLLIRNMTGVAFASSGNTLQYRTYTMASA